MEQITIAVNLLAMSISLWLGLYIITRSPRSPTSWLAAFAIWCAASLFLRNLLAIQLQTNGLRPWPRLIGLIGLPIWFHMTYVLRLETAQTHRLPHARHPVIGGLVYGLGCLAIAYDTYLLGALEQASPFTDQTGYYHLGRYGSLHPLIVGYFIWVGSHSLYNLWQARQAADSVGQKGVFTSFFVVTIPALCGGVYLGVGRYFFASNPPAFPGDMLIGMGIAGIGYTVARYHALIEGRTIERDMFYNLFGIGTATLCYGVLTLVLQLYSYDEVHLVVLVLIITCAIITHSLFDGARTTLDQIFYHRRFQQLRSHLRDLAREVGTQQTLTEQLEGILSGIQRTLHVQEGLIALRRGDYFVIVAAQNIALANSSFPATLLLAPTITEIPQLAIGELQNMGLLAPLQNGAGQIGALVLGPKLSNKPYTEEDLEILETLTHQIVTIVHHVQQQEENVRTIDAMITDFRIQEGSLQRQIQQLQDLLTNYEQTNAATGNRISNEQLVEAVNECLKYLNNVAKLSEHPLAHLAVVTACLQDQDASQGCSMARGHALRTVLLEAIYRLRPEGNEPKADLYTHEVWHLFVILRDLYELGNKVNDIRWKFPYADKTFYRRRTEAVEAVAKTLWQMEQEVTGAPVR